MTSKKAKKLHILDINAQFLYKDVLYKYNKPRVFAYVFILKNTRFDTYIYVFFVKIMSRDIVIQK
jgi:hypothetical protein